MNFDASLRLSHLLICWGWNVNDGGVWTMDFLPYIFFLYARMGHEYNKSFAFLYIFNEGPWTYCYPSGKCHYEWMDHIRFLLKGLAKKNFFL